MTHTRGSDHQPAWSPDGTRIAFVSARAGRPWLHEMRADGSRPRRLQRKAAGAWWPSWSPDGRQIAFLGGACHELSVWLIRTDGTAERRLATGRLRRCRPARPVAGRRPAPAFRRPASWRQPCGICVPTDSGAYRILVRGVNLDAMLPSCYAARHSRRQRRRPARQRLLDHADEGGRKPPRRALGPHRPAGNPRSGIGRSCQPVTPWIPAAPPPRAIRDGCRRLNQRLRRRQRSPRVPAGGLKSTTREASGDQAVSRVAEQSSNSTSAWMAS